MQSNSFKSALKKAVFPEAVGPTTTIRALDCVIYKFGILSVKISFIFESF